MQSQFSRKPLEEHPAVEISVHDSITKKGARSEPRNFREQACRNHVLSCAEKGVDGSARRVDRPNRRGEFPGKEDATKENRPGFKK